MAQWRDTKGGREEVEEGREGRRERKRERERTMC